MTPRALKEVAVCLLAVIAYGVLGAALALGAATIDPWLSIPVIVLCTYVGVCVVVALGDR